MVSRGVALVDFDLILASLFEFFCLAVGVLFSLLILACRLLCRKGFIFSNVSL